MTVAYCSICREKGTTRTWFNRRPLVTVDQMATVHEDCFEQWKIAEKQKELEKEREERISQQKRKEREERIAREELAKEKLAKKEFLAKEKQRRTKEELAKKEFLAKEKQRRVENLLEPFRRFKDKDSQTSKKNTSSDNNSDIYCYKCETYLSGSMNKIKFEENGKFYCYDCHDSKTTGSNPQADPYDVKYRGYFNYNDWNNPRY
jgi:hypothetical protein